MQYHVNLFHAAISQICLSLRIPATYSDNIENVNGDLAHCDLKDDKLSRATDKKCF